MFGSIGIFEIALISGLALMILGPEKFPEFAKLSMRTVRDIRKYVTEAQRDIASELNPLKKDFEGLKKVDVESYVEKLVNDDNDELVEDADESYNLEPDSSIVEDWYPEENNEIMPGGDETYVEESEEDATQENGGEPVPYGEDPNAHIDTTAGDGDIAPDDSEHEESLQTAGDYESRDEVVDTDDPERLDG